MHRPKTRPRIASGAAWMLAGAAGAALSQYLIVVALARVATPTAVGQYALGLAIATPACLLAALGLRTVLVTDQHGAVDFERYRRMRLLGACAAAGLISGIAWTLDSATGAVVTVVGLAKAVDMIIEIHIGLFQRIEWMRQAGLCLLINAGATIAGGALLLAFSPTALAAAGGSLAGSAVAWALYCVPTAQRVLATIPAAGAGWPAPRRSTADLARTALPLGLATFIAALAASLPRYVVGWQLDLAALGAFTAIAYVIVTANLVASAVSQALLPRMRRLIADHRQRRLLSMTAQLSVAAIALGVVGAVGCAVAGPAVLRLLYGSGYESYAPALVIVVAASGVSGAVFVVGTALSATRSFGSQLVVAVVTLVVTGVLAVVLVPHGVTVAMWTVLVPLLVDGATKTVALVRATQPVGAHRAVVGSAA